MGIEYLTTGETLVRIEEKSYFFDDSETVLAFENIPDIDIKVADSLYYPSIQVGYSKYADENINTLDDFSTKQTRGTTIRAINKEKRLLSDVLASGYSIEFTRRDQFLTSGTSGTKHDNDKFFICVVRDGVTYDFESEKDQNFPTVENLLDPATAYNLRISPARNFLRHSDWLAATFYNIGANVWRYQDGVGNTEMKTTSVASTCPSEFVSEVDENADFIASAYKPALIIPEFVIFDAPLQVSEFILLQDNKERYKQITVSDRTDNIITGYLWSLDYKPSQGTATITLIRAAP
jgi:hypothetical protein